MTVTVLVGVALTRPPRVHRYSKIVLEVPVATDLSDIDRAENQAVITACHMAMRPDVVMVVSTEILEVEL